MPLHLASEQPETIFGGFVSDYLDGFERPSEEKSSGLSTKNPVFPAASRYRISCLISTVFLSADCCDDGVYERWPDRRLAGQGTCQRRYGLYCMCRVLHHHSLSISIGFILGPEIWLHERFTRFRRPEPFHRSFIPWMRHKVHCVPRYAVALLFSPSLVPWVESGLLDQSTKRSGPWKT